jgi:hypothetical protein
MGLSAKKPTRMNEGKAEALAEISKEKTIKLNVDVHESKHTAFKAKCAQNKEKMSDAIKRFIDEYIK